MIMHACIQQCLTTNACTYERLFACLCVCFVLCMRVSASACMHLMYICICDGQASMKSGVFVVVTVWMDNTIYP